ncbi:MAG: hypothetical protein R3C18_27810 [Planctomycetaceae bacterium]
MALPWSKYESDWRILLSVLTERLHRADDEAMPFLEVSAAELFEYTSSVFFRHYFADRLGTKKYDIAICCSVMKVAMQNGDIKVAGPIGMDDASYRVRYALPRLDRKVKHHFTVDRLTVGDSYDRWSLAKYWGLSMSTALLKGILAPLRAQLVMLFVTEDRFPSRRHNGKTIWFRVEWDHRYQRLADSKRLELSVFLFWRPQDETEFVYHGKVESVSSQRVGDEIQFELRLEEGSRG